MTTDDYLPLLACLDFFRALFSRRGAVPRGIIRSTDGRDEMDDAMRKRRRRKTDQEHSHIPPLRQHAPPHCRKGGSSQSRGGDDPPCPRLSMPSADHSGPEASSHDVLGPHINSHAHRRDRETAACGPLLVDRRGKFTNDRAFFRKGKCPAA